MEWGGEEQPQAQEGRTPHPGEAEQSTGSGLERTQQTPELERPTAGCPTVQKGWGAGDTGGS